MQVFFIEGSPNTFFYKDKETDILLTIYSKFS